MPDWVGHLAIGLAAGKGLRVRNLRWLLLGSVLPDVNYLLAFALDFDLLPLGSAAFLLVMFPLCSLLAYACYSAAVATATDSPLRAFGLLLLGALTHVGIDSLQVGHIEMLFFPFSLAIQVGSAYPYGTGGYPWIAAGALLVLLLGRLLPQENDIRIRWRGMWRAVLPLLLLAVVAALSISRLEKADVYRINFLRGGDAPPAGTRAVHVSCFVQSSDPLVVKDCGRDITVRWPRPIAKGELVALWGVYQDDCSVLADKIVLMHAGTKWLFMVMGVAVLCLYWFRIPFMDDRARRRNALHADRSGA